MIIKKVLIKKKFIKYLEDRNLGNQYKKAKEYILSGNYIQANLKSRKPKNDGIFYFRINKQYRALCKKDGDILNVFFIDNHQD